MPEAELFLLFVRPLRAHQSGPSRNRRSRWCADLARSLRFSRPCPAHLGWRSIFSSLNSKSRITATTSNDHLLSSSRFVSFPSTW